MADQLATPEDLAALLQQDLDRATAELLIECATAVVQAAARQRIVEVTETATLYLDQYDDGTWLYLPERPVTAVSAIQIGASPVSDWSPQLSRGRIFRSSGWRSTLIAYPDQPNTVSVTYTHGYSIGDQRLQLARSATLSLAAQGYTNPGGATREQIDDYSVQFSEMSARMETSPNLIASLQKQYGISGHSVRLVAR